MAADDNDRTESVGGFGDDSDRPRIKRLGHFRIDATLGSGGMGTIYRAYDESMKRPVALKVLHSSLEISQRAQSRFVREAWIAGQLDHPNIVKVYSRGEENNVSYLAMELAEGGSLHDYIERTRESIPSGSDVTGTIDRDYINDILGKFIELAGALEHIHVKGFIHRDIKPHNILLSDPDKKFKLTDFGIAHADDMTRMTRAGDFIGTVKYMSPELLAAHRAGIDRRTDIYSLGVTLYEALTLTLPFKADSEEKLIGEILVGHYIEARQTNRRIPVDLETVLMKASHHDPDRRYQTAAEFAEDLQRIIDGRPILARRQSAFSKGIKYVRRNYKAVLAVAAVVVVLVSVILWSYYKVEQAYRIGDDESTQFESSVGPTFTKIDVPGLPNYCALSPDGEKLAFVADDSCLWIAPTHGTADFTVAGEPIRLTDPLGIHSLYCLPVWSADGRWIAFNAQDSDSASSYWTSMYVIASSGGELIEVPVKHDCLRSLRFWDFRISLAPDGKDIAFFSHTSPISGDSKEDCIYTMPVSGGEIKRLTDSLCWQPAYSPDGKMLAFLRGDQYCGLVNESGGCNIWVVPVEDGSPVQVTDLPGVEFGPVWSPDGKKIAFSQWTETEVKDLCEINELSIVSLSEKYQPLGPPTVIELPLPSDDFIGGWSTGDEIGLVLETETHIAIYTISASGGIAAMVRPSISRCPSWSPDGERIYYLTGNDVYSVPAGGGQESIVPITGMEDIGYEGGCDLSHDGTRLALSGIKEGDSVLHIFTVLANGGEPRQVTFDSSEDWFPRWSPDGNWIAFSRSVSDDDSESHLCVVPAGGGEVIELVAATDSCGFSDGLADWSPDGKLIAYPSYHNDSLKGISVMPSNGGAPELLVELEPGRASLSVRWSPDGKKLAYTSYGFEYGKVSADIWILSLDTRKPRKLQMIGYDLDAASRADWSPDGERIVFTGSRASRNTLCLIDNFLPLSQPAEPEPPAEPESKEMTVRMAWSGDKMSSTDLERLSPDGRFVSFSNRWVGDLSILELASKEIHLLTNNWAIWGAVDTMPEEHRPAFVDSLLKFGGVDGGSVWSPDGSQLAYAWVSWVGEELGDLFLIRRDGADPKILTAGENEKVKHIIPYDWSRDGEYILAGGTIENDDIRLMSISAVDGSAREIVTIEVSPNDWFKGGYFSPDGRYVAYTSPDNDIFLLSVDGRSSEPLVEHPARDYLLGWSPDGRWVCFASDRSGATDVWVIGVSDGEPQGEPQKVSRNIGDIIPLGITGEGSLYYGLGSGIVDVYVATIDPEAGKLLTSPKKATQRFEGTNDWPDWSPGGKHLLYRSDREAADNLGAKSPLCVRSMETGEEQELYVQLRWFNAHHYSPDGRFVIVQGVDNDGQNGLFQIDLETGLTTILVKCAADTRIRWATWSPDGGKLFYKYMVTSEEPYTRLMRYDLETRQEKELFRENSWPTCPALSPDGQWLAFQTLDGEKMIRSLNIMPADSGRLREIVRLDGGESIYSVDWMPDGRSILYVKNTVDQPKQRELWQISAEGGSPRNLGLAMDNITYLSIHPDGRQIAFSAYKRQTEIWLMENFLPED